MNESLIANASLDEIVRYKDGFNESQLRTALDRFLTLYSEEWEDLEDKNEELKGDITRLENENEELAIGSCELEEEVDVLRMKLKKAKNE